MDVINVSVRMTLPQLESLIKLFDDHFVGAVRAGENAKDMAYICEMVDIYNKLKKAQQKATSNTETADEETTE